jgi:hypothetical protein
LARWGGKRDHSFKEADFRIENFSYKPGGEEMRRFIVMLFLVLISISLGSKLVATPLEVIPSGAEVSVSYQEPTTNADATPLNDLAKTNIFYDIGDGPVMARETSAISVNGGGNVIEKITLPVAQGQILNVTFWATATDTSGNESIKSQEVSLRIDLLPPAPPN